MNKTILMWFVNRDMYGNLIYSYSHPGGTEFRYYRTHAEAKAFASEHGLEYHFNRKHDPKYDEEAECAAS